MNSIIVKDKRDDDVEIFGFASLILLSALSSCPLTTQLMLTTVNFVQPNFFLLFNLVHLNTEPFVGWLLNNGRQHSKQPVTFARLYLSMLQDVRRNAVNIVST